MQHSQLPSRVENLLSMPDDPAEDDSSDDAHLPSDSSFRERFYDASDEERLQAALASSHPIELEIGSGKGLFLTRAALDTPQHIFIGMELATKYARESQARLEKQSISNACFIACDAVAVMQHEVKDASLHAVHVYFPDPWWKSRHKKRRVLSDGTILNIQRTLVPGGKLHFWTDVLDYYEEAVARIGELTRLAGPFYVPEPDATHDMDYRTHFERRTRLNGLPVYRARFEKTP
jgi:tRNA (guanine-N7-)-methyltransferase